MSGFQDLKGFFRPHRDLIGQRPGPEEDLHRQTDPLDVMLTPERKLQRAGSPADLQQLSGVKEDQDQEDSEPPHIKEEQEEAETIKSTFSPAPVKSEDDKEEPQPSQLEHMDCGGPGPDPEGHSGLMSEVKTEDSSEPGTDVGDGLCETGDPQSGSNSEENIRDQGRGAVCGPEGEKPFSCSECGKVFVLRSQLETHMIIHTGGKPFSCPDCGNRYKYQGHLTAHMQAHTGEKPYGCSECGKRLSTNENLTVHKRSHTGEKPFSCYECGKTFNQKGSLARHMLVHSGEKPFSCSVCCRRFNRKWHLNRHLLVHGAEKPFSCSECSLRFNTESGLILHTTFHRGDRPYSFRPPCYSQIKILTCVGGQTSEAGPGTEGEDCAGPEPARSSDPEIYTQAEIEVKIEDSSDPETEDSEEDWRETRGLNPLRNDAVPQSPATCESNRKHLLCSESEEPLRTHRDRHTAETPSSRPERNNQSTERGGLDQHIHKEGPRGAEQEDPEPRVIKEEQEEVWISQAETTKSTFSPVPVKSEDDEEGPQSSQLHQRHTEHMDCGGPGPDRDSGPETEDSAELETEDSADSDFWKDSDVNTKDKNPDSGETHGCSECGKTFKNKQNLSIHMTVHTGEKPFSCSECGKRFNRKGSLTRHMLLYRGEKPFSCSVCSKRFNRKWHLTRHMLVHKAEKPFNCSVCSVRFNKESGLTLHMAFHRGKKPDSCSV